MAWLPVPLLLRLLLLAAVASSSPTMFARDDKCAAGGLQSCAPQGLPSSFCCETGTRCMALAGNSTVMCCPKGSSCDAVRPITCDINAQNPDSDLRAPIKTLAQNSTLPRCAANDSCCPFGFSCAGDGKLCVRDQDQSTAPEGYAAVVSSAPTAVSTSTAEKSSSAAATLTAATLTAATSTGTPSATASAQPSHAAENEPMPAGKASIIGGTVGGVFALVFLGVVIFLCLRSRKGDSASAAKFPYSQSSSSSRSSGPKISAPIADPETSYRTDFIRKTPSLRSSRPSSPASRFSQTPQLKIAPPMNTRLSIPNPFDSPTLSANSHRFSRYSVASNDFEDVYTGQVGAKLQPIRSLTPSVSRQSRRTSRRYVEGTAGAMNHVGQRHNRQTSFSDMMEEAKMGDVNRGQAYVPGGERNHVPGTTPRI